MSAKGNKPTRKRGRLPTPGIDKNHDHYKCIIENCDTIVRGDRIKWHFKKMSKLEILDEAKKMDVTGEIVNGLKHIDSMLIDDKIQRDHTRWLLSNGYSSMKLPNCDTEGFKKRPTVSLPNAFKNAGFKATSSKVIYLIED